MAARAQGLLDKIGPSRPFEAGHAFATKELETRRVLALRGIQVGQQGAIVGDAVRAARCVGLVSQQFRALADGLSVQGNLSSC